MPKGVHTLGVDDVNRLVQACPKGRMRLCPAATTALRTWLLLVGARHQRAGDAARAAWEEARDPAQLSIIERSNRAVKLIAELVSILSDRFDRSAWHDAAAMLYDVAATFAERADAAT